MQSTNFAKQFSAEVHQVLPIDKSFDCVSTVFNMVNGTGELIFIDGFAKDEVMERIMQYLMAVDISKKQPLSSLAHLIPYLEVGTTTEVQKAVDAVLSGALLFLAQGAEEACIIDARTYPVRSMQEPEDERVLRGSRDAFVETLIFNTALIRRRVRDPLLIHEFMTVGIRSKTDISLCYIEDKVNPDLLAKVKEKLNNTKVEGLSLSQESLAECLLPRQWLNPFPRIRFTERPDTASASVLEGNLIVLIDNTPAVMLLPTHFFDFFQEANDYYFPPFIGTYLKLVRILIYFLTLFFTPCWYLAITYPDLVPSWLKFVLIEQTAAIPVLMQLLIIEVMIDGLRLASLNTPSSLSSAFSILGAVILGEYAVSTGWFNGEVILYMAFVALSNYAQPSFELGYSFKFFRILLLLLVALAGPWGLLAGTICLIVVLLKTDTLSGNYLYPLYPFDGVKLCSILFRKPVKHKD